MDTENTPSQSWDATWRAAVTFFGELDTDAMRSMSALVSELADSPDVRGLFAVTSMATLRISPYTCYPDWFDGRHITIDASSDGVSVCLASSGHDPDPRRWTCSFADAPNLIASLCRDHM